MSALGSVSNLERKVGLLADICKSVKVIYNSGTGGFTKIDFNKGLFDTGNHDTFHLGLGIYTWSQCIGGLSMGDQEQSGGPATIREKYWARVYVDLEMLLRVTRS